MHKFLVSALALTLLGLTSQAQATDAHASIDWSSFSVVLTDLDASDGITPGITWTSQTSHVFTAGGSNANAPDWTTPITANSADESAGANGSVLEAHTWPQPGFSYVHAESGRSGDFLLTGNTKVSFSVPGYISGSADGLDEALTYLGVFVSGAAQNDFDELSITAPPDIGQPKTLSVSFLNTTDGDMTGHLGAVAMVEAYAAPVPEPESHALLAAGLGLLAWRVSRRPS